MLWISIAGCNYSKLQSSDNAKVVPLHPRMGTITGTDSRLCGEWKKMKFYDYWAEHLHLKVRRFPRLGALLCRMGLHWWGWIGDLENWMIGPREYWTCDCGAEKFIDKRKEQRAGAALSE